MKFALSIWNGRIAPVFDVSQRLVIYEAERDTITAAREITLSNHEQKNKAEQLANLRIETLICGALSRCLADCLLHYNIKTIPFIAGGMEEVAAAFLKGALPSAPYCMPGCCGRGRRHRGGTSRLRRNLWRL